jgi:hypothetical protein
MGYTSFSGQTATNAWTTTSSNSTTGTIVLGQNDINQMTGYPYQQIFQPFVAEEITYNKKKVKKEVFGTFPFKKNLGLSLSAQLQGDFDKFTSGIRKELFA